MSIQTNRKVFNQAQDAWQREEGRLAEIRMIDRSIRGVQLEKTMFESHFASKGDVVPFLDTLEKTALLVGVRAEVASVDTQDEAGLTIALRASGTFESLYKLLVLLENSRYELKIDGLELQRESLGEGTPSTKWRAVFLVKLLSYVK
ncbi:MAG: hypothetical protein ACKOW9_01190 [Candidatus Paceibacterota bacterium]